MPEVPGYHLDTKFRETDTVSLFRGYRAKDGVPVVVKVLRREYPTSLELARLRHEHAIVTALDSPHVVRALALEPTGHGLALVLEDAGEVSLDKLITEKALELRQALQIAIALTDAVGAVHRHGIVHKDIKPHHFFVNPDDPTAIVLIDFGIASRLSQEVQAASPVTQLEGSLPYIAPEQTGRMNRLVDQRSDLYALGATFYELFTGRLPFRSSDPLELVHSHVARLPRPPRAIRAELPEVVSDIIVRLLAKVAESRYQSAAGLRHDLSRCLEQLESTGHIESFPLGEHDATGQLKVPQKLYGRAQDLECLLGAFDRVRQGAAELLLLSGHSGVGKSALVNELHKEIVRGGYFAAGKFDYLSRSVPYAPLVHACRELIRAVLAEPEKRTEQRRQQLLQALGANGQVLIDLVPDLELLIGPQPAVPELGPGESQTRFELVFQRFFDAFASALQPLVLFLDDLQWADGATLRLLQLVLTAPGAAHRLVIGAYRDTDVDASHPLTSMLEALGRVKASVTSLELAPLAVEHVTELLADTVGAKPAAVSPLARVLLAKTGGNPFFLNQFLTTLHRDGILAFDHERGEWGWELKRVETTMATDNVVDFMLSRLRELSEESQQVLQLAACIGHEFDAETLSVVSRTSRAELRRRLWPALSEGLIVPLDGNYRFGDEAIPSAAGDSLTALNATYRFLHDRVQQAAYALIDETRKRAVHLSVGRLLLQQGSGEPKDERLFDATNHLNHGATLVEDAEEKRLLARLNLSAGRKAVAAAAPAAASHYLAHAIDLFGCSAWDGDYEAVLEAHLLKAQAEYLNANPEAAFELLDAVEERARTTLDRIPGRNLRTVVLTNMSRLEEASAYSLATAALLGVDLPDPADRAALGAAIGENFGAYQAARGDRSIESLADLPMMTDPWQLALISTYANAIPAAFQSNPDLFALLIIKAVQMPLEYGTAPPSPMVYAQYGIAHAVATQDHDAAYRFGRLGLELAERASGRGAAGPVRFIFAGFLSHWRRHISETLEHLPDAIRESLELGDPMHATYSASFRVHYGLYAGRALDQIIPHIAAVQEMAERTDDIINLGFNAAARQFIEALQGRTASLSSLESGDFKESEFEAAASPPVLAIYGVLKAAARYFGGDAQGAVSAADETPELPGVYYKTERRFYRALGLAQLARKGAADEREPLLSRMRDDGDMFEQWAAAGPENHAHRLALIRAELAAVEGDTARAMTLYEEAIDGAQAQGFTHLQALANELCGRFHLADGRVRVARPYLSEARYTYQRWGATAKADQLGSSYAEVLAGTASETGRAPASAPASALTDEQPRSAGQSTTVTGGRQLDLATAIRATQALAMELRLDRLLERLMRLLIESAGAQRGFLLLDRGGELELEASATVDPDEVRLGLGQRLQTDSPLACAVVQYVARTKAPVVLADAAADARFAGDRYVAEAKPRSLLCLAMLHQGRLTGVLYFENNAATDVFVPARVELLEFLAAQAAVAVQNATLYGEVQARTAELKRANETLESQVAERTEALSRALSELWSEMDLARKIQTVLLPSEQRLGDYRIAASMTPADSVGGDYYDVFRTGETDWLLIGDVSGHGVTAGLCMMMVQTAVRSLALAGADRAERLRPSELLAQLNRAVSSNLQKVGQDQYMTLMALQLDGATVRYSGLHQDILVYRAATHRVERVPTRGAWIAIIDDVAPVIADETFQMAAGDVLLLFSDGFTEAVIDGKRVETDGLAALLRDLAEGSTEPEAIVRGLESRLKGCEVDDDMTVLALRYDPHPGAP